MMQREFESLTGVCVSPRLYSLVERYYMLTTLSKQEFVYRHFSSCFSESDVYTRVKRLAFDYYPDSDLSFCEDPGLYISYEVYSHGLYIS